jgi:hypothetical protein
LALISWYKTWGGLVEFGMFQVLLMELSLPSSGFYNIKGEWDIENKGISPDIMSKMPN